jgi:hypothetical protein
MAKKKYATKEEAAEARRSQAREHYRKNTQYYKDYYQNNKEACKAASIKWHQENKERYNKYSKEYQSSLYKKDPKSYNEKTMKYRNSEKGKEKSKEYHKKWVEKNRSKYNEYHRNYYIKSKFKETEGTNNEKKVG